ncbi:MAG: sugar phosphate isomerase/epimerase family protein [Gemmataceae bacterium]
MLSRRQFLAAGAALTAAGPLAAIEPINRHGPAHLKLSLAAYSFNKQLDRRKKDAKPSMTLEGFVNLAAGWGLSAVEPTAYYFAETTPEYLAKLKGQCTRLGLDISGTAVGNNFCVADADKLKAQVADVKAWTEHSARLGAKTMRIFAGTVAKGDTERAAFDRCVNAIGESCDHAAKWGVYLALENHGGIVATAEQMLAMVTAVKHDWFGVNLDTGNFHSPDPYADMAKLAPYTVTVQVKTEIMRGEKQPKEEADLRRVIDILKAANYRGYVALEYEAAADPMTAVPKYLGQLKTLIG